jgi:hypothetical protein
MRERSEAGGICCSTPDATQEAEFDNRKEIGGPGEDSNLHLRILPAVFLGYTTGPC